MTLDGTSYGSYVASRYAVTFPDRVDHLILDSVVPHTWTDDGTLQLANIRGVRRVLPMVCRETSCETDPLADLATLIDNGFDGPELMNLMAVISVSSGTDMGFVPGMLHDAVEGDRQVLDGWLEGVAEDPPVDEYSAGLHAATVCLDQHLPWGDSATPLEEREAALERTAAALTEQETYPFDPQTVVDQGLVGECVDWGVTPPDEESDARELPDIPTLFLIGDHDLSTSWEWARQEVRVAPDPTVMVVKGAGSRDAGVRRRVPGGAHPDPVVPERVDLDEARARSTTQVSEALVRAAPSMWAATRPSGRSRKYWVNPTAPWVISTSSRSAAAWTTGSDLARLAASSSPIVSAHRT